jgi:hypothetical protein
VSPDSIAQFREFTTTNALLWSNFRRISGTETNLWQKTLSLVERRISENPRGTGAIPPTASFKPDSVCEVPKHLVPQVPKHIVPGVPSFPQKRESRLLLEKRRRIVLLGV